MKSVDLEVRIEAGLHARPAAAFVRLAAGFHSRIGLENASLDGPAADARSLTSVLAAGVERGHRVRIWADGDDEDAAVSALAEMLAGDGSVPPSGGVLPSSGGAESVAPGPVAPGPVASSGVALPSSGGAARLRGVPAAPGIAIGPIWRPGAATAEAGAEDAHSPEGLRRAAALAAEQLNALASGLCDMDRTGEAEILEAQAMIASDPALLDAATALIGEGRSVAAAIVEAGEAAARRLESLEDELLPARAADVRDVAARIARNAAGGGVAPPSAPSIVVAADLPPSVLVEMPRGAIAGVALASGTPTAHVAILARGLGIPAVVAVEGLAEPSHGAPATPPAGGGATPATPATPPAGGAATPATPATAAIDGETGEVVLDPDRADVARLSALGVARAERRRHAASLRGRPAATGDGHRVELLANIRSGEDAPRALAAGAEGVGLFRTEFLFLHRREAPTEDEQVAAYRRAMAVFGPDRPVVVRLADIGGDKQAPYLGLAEESNPFLGVRAIRLAHGSRDLLLTQLRAIWRAAGAEAVTPYVMAPMVATVADARLLLELRDEARASVVAAGRTCPDRMETGVMIEVPSAAVLAPELARLVDFFSIGTNDLTQYILAADRGNPALARFQDALHPAVLRTIASVVAAASGAGIEVAACGELAGDPAGALVLAGLGVDELSADPGSLDEVRLALAGVAVAEIRELASRALAASDAETVRALAGRLLGRA